jgi:hypothetical protein
MTRLILVLLMLAAFAVGLALSLRDNAPWILAVALLSLCWSSFAWGCNGKGARP